MKIPILLKFQKEEDTVKAVTDYSALIGIKLFRHRERIPGRNGKRYRLSEAGLPDLFGWIPRRLMQFGLKSDPYPVPLYVECKRAVGGVISEEQLAFASLARKDGAIILFPNTLETYIKGLRFCGVDAPEV